MVKTRMTAREALRIGMDEQQHGSVSLYDLIRAAAFLSQLSSQLGLELKRRADRGVVQTVDGAGATDGE